MRTTLITIPASSGAVARSILEQCETGFQVLSQPLPLDVMSTGWAATHVRPRRWTSRTQPFRQMEVGRIWSGTRRRQLEVLRHIGVPNTESFGEVPQFGRRSRRRLRLVWDDPQSDVHVHGGDGGDEWSPRGLRQSRPEICPSQWTDATREKRSSRSFPIHQDSGRTSGFVDKSGTVPRINSGPRSMCL